jgi:hypothetical protein
MCLLLRGHHAVEAEDKARNLRGDIKAGCWRGDFPCRNGLQTVWQDLEVENEMSRGLLPGLVVLSGKLAPTLRATTQRTLHSVAQVHP